jgi:hypothetical protein
MKIRLAFLFALPLLAPLAYADDAVDQPPAATPADKHVELKNAASSDAKNLPPAVLEAKKRLAVEKRTLDLHVKDVITQFGPTSPQAIQAKEDARARLAQLRREIAIARQKR